VSEELTRSDLTLVRSALRQDWPISAGVKVTILQRLIDYLDREHEEGATASDRLVISAARTLVEFMRLGLEQQRLDLLERKLDGGRGKGTLADLVGEAEARALDRLSNGAPDGAPGPIV
jgi:hypothetical protein